MSLSDRLQANLQQYEALDRSVRILRSSIEQMHENARDIEQALRVLRSALNRTVATILGIAFLGGFFAVVFLRVGQWITDWIMGAISRWWAG